MPHVRAGRVKAFAVTTKDRIAIAPEIPSAEEAGFSWLQFSLRAGLFAPKGTPRDIIDKLNAAAVGTTHDPAMHQKLVDQGFVIPLRERQTPEALGAYQSRDRQMVADHQGGWHQGGMIQPGTFHNLRYANLRILRRRGHRVSPASGHALLHLLTAGYGTFRNCRRAATMSAHEGKPD